MSDLKDFNKYYSSVDKNLLENMFKNNNLKNLINLSTKTDLYVFNRKNKKWQLKSKDKLLKECDQIKKKDIKESSLMLSNLAKLSKINEYNSVSDIYNNLQSKIANIDKIVDCINHIGLSSESNDIDSNENFKPNIVRFDEITKEKIVSSKINKDQIKGIKDQDQIKGIQLTKIDFKLNKVPTDAQTDTQNKVKNKYKDKNSIIKLNIDDSRVSSASSSENYIECYGNC
jgi:hypothetical protein